jgi:Phosphoglycerate kinase/Major Facilitator Superfamily
MHRKHASVYDVPLRRISVAGYLVRAEVAALLRLTADIQRPYVVVLGGAKVADKFDALGSLLSMADRIRSAGPWPSRSSPPAASRPAPPCSSRARSTRLNLEFFRRRRFSAAAGSVGLVTFGLFGALFVMTQFLQFGLGYSALQAGIRALPAAGAIAIVAPLSTAAVRVAGTKLTVAAGLLAVAGGLWQLSTASAATTYTGVLPGLVLLGVGAGLAIPSATESVMGSLPAAHTGVGSATNGAFLQIGGALGWR